MSHQSRLDSESNTESKSETFPLSLLPILIVVDNTNTTLQEYLPYQKLASDYAATTLIFEMDISHLHQPYHPLLDTFPVLSSTKVLKHSQNLGTHDVPLQSLIRMWSRLVVSPYCYSDLFTYISCFFD